MFGIEIPIIIGLVAVGVAVLERSYKTFLEKKAVDPELKFNGAYLLNALISTGIGVSIVTAVIPAVLAEISNAPSVPLTLGAVIMNFILGYAATYRILDAFNNSTSKAIAVEEAEQ